MTTPVAPVQSGILSYHLKTKDDLYRSYMPFLKNGGIFVPNDRRFNLGQEVFLLLILPEESERHPIAGTVAWWSSSAFDSRPKGVGIHFLPNPTTDTLRNRIEVLLAGYPTDRATYTM